MDNVDAGGIVRAFWVNELDQPAGNVDVRLKVLFAQVLVSLFVTDTVKVTLCPRFALGFDGEMLTDGLAAMQAGAP